MRPFLLLAAGLGIATAAPPPAQAQPGFTPCDGRVAAIDWSRHPRPAHSTFRWRATLVAPSAVRVQVHLNMRFVSLDAGVLRPLHLRAGVPLTLWVAESIEPLVTSTVARATTLTCAAAAG